MPYHLLNSSDIESFQCDGGVLVKGLFADYVDKLRARIAHNMEVPGPYAAEILRTGENSRVFDDYCNWQRIPEFEVVVQKSQALQSRLI